MSTLGQRITPSLLLASIVTLLWPPSLAAGTHEVPTMPGPTIVVCASDSKDKGSAKYRCDGANDH